MTVFSCIIFSINVFIFFACIFNVFRIFAELEEEENTLVKDRREEAQEILKQIRKIFIDNNNLPLSANEIQDKLKMKDRIFLNAVLAKGCIQGHPEARKYMYFF